MSDFSRKERIIVVALTLWILFDLFVATSLFFSSATFNVNDALLRDCVTVLLVGAIPAIITIGLTWTKLSLSISLFWISAVFLYSIVDIELPTGNTSFDLSAGPPFDLSSGFKYSYPNATYYVDDYKFEGDSFRVIIYRHFIPIRLYNVDTPEITIHDDDSRERAREQGRYFGLRMESSVTKWGKEASDFVKKQLSRPFTVYTNREKTLDGKRNYARVEFSNGEFLSESLIDAGLARVSGASPKQERGTPFGDVVNSVFKSKESVAKKTGAGIWRRSFDLSSIWDKLKKDPTGENLTDEEKFTKALEEYFPSDIPIAAEKPFISPERIIFLKKIGIFIAIGVLPVMIIIGVNWIRFASKKSKRSSGN